MQSESREGDSRIFLKCVGSQVQADSPVSGEEPASSKAGRVHSQHPEPPRLPPAPGPPRGLGAPGRRKKVSKRRCSALIGRGGRGPVARQPMSGVDRSARAGAGARGPSRAALSQSRLLLPPLVLVAGSRVSAEPQLPLWVAAARGPPPPPGNSCPAPAPAALSEPPAAAVQGPWGSPCLRVASWLPGLCGAGCWARESRFSAVSLTLCRPPLAFCRPAPRPCQLSSSCCPRLSL